MLGTTLIRMWRVRESTSRSSEANLKAIADGTTSSGSGYYDGYDYYYDYYGDDGYGYYE